MGVPEVEAVRVRVVVGVLDGVEVEDDVELPV